MIAVKSGDTVKMRDGRTVMVTDVADQNPDAARWYADDGVTIKAEMPVETIFIGFEIGAEPTVVSDMSEVVEILN